MSTKPILLSGGTGLVGRRFLQRCAQARQPVCVLSRNAAQARTQLPPQSEAMSWDGKNFYPELVRGMRAVVHLAGEPIFGGRLNEVRKARIRASRIDSTQSLVAAIAALPEAERPSLLVCASAVGIYGDGGETVLDENQTNGLGFLAEVCRDWETAANRATDFGVRVVTPRFGIVLAREGGALPTMLTPFRLGLGGPLGSGKQWMPWIDVHDLARLLEHILETPTLSGPLNAVAPGAVRNEEFSRCLAKVLHRPCIARVPEFAVRLALQELSSELLDSRRVSPQRLLDSGFTFGYPNLEPALREALGQS